jgi:hypothetical protein
VLSKALPFGEGNWSKAERPGAGWAFSRARLDFDHVNHAASTFEDLIHDAERAPFEGWDFSFVEGRMVEDALPWDYVAEVRRRMACVKSMLDLGTGGGEVLSQLAPLPALTVATEAYAPNALVAARRLSPLGAHVERGKAHANSSDAATTERRHSTIKKSWVQG